MKIVPYKSIIILLLLLVLGINCQAQTRFNIVTDFGHREMNIFNSITPLDDGYIIVVGTGNNTLFNDNRCSMLVKTDNEGNKLHSTFIGDAQYRVSEGLVSVNSVYVSNVGTYKFTFNIGPNIKLLSYEFDENLQIIDTVTIKTDTTAQTKKLCSVYTEDYICIGGQYLPDFTEYLVKYDNNGNVITEAERTNNIGIGNLILNNNCIIAAGLMCNNNHNWVVQKLDTSLNIIWQKTYGRNNMINGVQIFIASSPDSCYVISGLYPVCYANSSHDRYWYSGCVRKIDDNGNLLWEKIIKNYSPSPLYYLDDEFFDLYVDDSGYIYVAGKTIFNNYSRTGCLTKLSPQGEIMYIRHYEPTGRGEHRSAITYLNSVKPTPDGGLIMGGYTYDSYYTPDFGDYYQQPWLVKTDMNGLDGLCYTELPELDFDVFIPDTVCNMDTIDCVVNISGPSAPYTLEFSTGQVIDSIYYPDTYVPYDFGIDRPISSEYLYSYSDYVSEAVLKKNTTWEDIIARHYNIATPTHPGEQQLAITLTDFYGNTKTIYKDIYVNPCHEVEVDEDKNVVLSVYPNPARENIIVEGENIAEIEICNLLGEVVYEINMVAPRHDCTISTDGMGAGSYFVRVTMKDGKIITKKIVVM